MKFALSLDFLDNYFILCDLCYIFRLHVFFFNDPATTEIYTLSLHDALPIYQQALHHDLLSDHPFRDLARDTLCQHRSEEHTSELQSRSDLVCRLLLEKKKKNKSLTNTKPTPKHSVNCNS